MLLLRVGVEENRKKIIFDALLNVLCNIKTTL